MCVRAGYRRGRSVLAEGPSEDSFNAPIVPIAEMSRTDDQVTSHVGPSRRRRVSTPHQTTRRGKAGWFLSSDSDCHLPRRSGQRQAGDAAAAARPRSSPRAGLLLPAAAAALTAAAAAAAATQHLGDPTSQSTCCSDEVAAQPRAGDIIFFFLRTTSWVRRGIRNSSAPFPPAPRFRTQRTPGDAQARVPVTWPGASAGWAAGCGAGRPPQQQRCARESGRRSWGAPLRCPRCSGGGGGAGGSAWAGVRTGSWGRGDLGAGAVSPAAPSCRLKARGSPGGRARR